MRFTSGPTNYKQQGQGCNSQGSYEYGLLDFPNPTEQSLLIQIFFKFKKKILKKTFAHVAQSGLLDLKKKSHPTIYINFGIKNCK